MPLIRPSNVPRPESRTRGILRRMTVRFLNATLLTFVALLLDGFIDRGSPETTVARLVLLLAAGIMLVTVLTADDE